MKKLQCVQTDSKPEKGQMVISDLKLLTFYGQNPVNYLSIALWEYRLLLLLQSVIWKNVTADGFVKLVPE